MMTRFTISVVLFFSYAFSAGAQSVISGKITDKKGEPLPGANIFIKGSFDGATSDLKGLFTFKTDEEGTHTIVASFMGFNTAEQQVTINNQPLTINFSLAEVINKLDGVIITAGSFEASDEKKGVVLKPLDIAMTAGATADISGALNTLPGTQTVGESGRLFVRGGESHETKVFVDGLQVNNFFGISAPNTAARGRFSPFLFKGTIFSTGGYSAEYGQALSSALILNSNDFPEEDRTDINFMSVGISAAKTKIWNKTSLTTEASYSNLAPYMSIIKQDLDWVKAPESAEASFVFRQKARKNGFFKMYGNFNWSGLEMNQEDLNEPEKNNIKMGNKFYYLNASYKDAPGKSWYFSGGTSIGITQEDIWFNLRQISDKEVNIHSKAVLTNELNQKITLKFGAELLNEVYNQSFLDTDKEIPFKLNYTENLSAAFLESDIYLSNRFVFRGGLRAERSTLLNQNNIAPRLSLAYKTGEKGQFSLAYGEFFQSPQKQFLKLNPQLDYTQATHYIINYQRIYNDRIFRIEAFRKEYNSLIKFDRLDHPLGFSGLNNLGTGYANGADLFIRDRKTIKNGDFWISYSLLDSKRDHQNYPGLSRVSLFSTHNFSFVYKHWISPLRTQVGATYNFASGRSYHNPNLEGFMNSKTKSFNDISFNAAFLYKPNIILYVSATNLLGFENIFGYQFSEQPDANGVYAQQAIGQPAPRFLFIGLFITLTKDKKLNQLENLN